MSERTLKILHPRSSKASAVCTCPKCAAAKPATPPVSPQRVIDYVRSTVPPPPDLNEAIRKAAKEKK